MLTLLREKKYEILEVPYTRGTGVQIVSLQKRT